MRKIAAVLLMAALTALAAQSMSDTSATEFQFSAIGSEAGVAPVSPPLMYAGIRG